MKVVKQLEDLDVIHQTMLGEHLYALGICDENLVVAKFQIEAPGSSGKPKLIELVCDRSYRSISARDALHLYADRLDRETGGAYSRRLDSVIRHEKKFIRAIDFRFFDAA